MNDVNFDKIISKLQEIHKCFPDLRFGIILQNALDSVKRTPNVNFTDISSKHVLRALTEYCEQTKKVRKYRGD